MKYLLFNVCMSLLDHILDKPVKQYSLEGVMNSFPDIGHSLSPFAEVSMDLTDGYSILICGTFSKGTSTGIVALERTDLKSICQYVLGDEYIWTVFDQVLQNSESNLAVDIRKEYMLCLENTGYKDWLRNMYDDAYNSSEFAEKQNTFSNDNLCALSVSPKSIHQRNIWNVFEICIFLCLNFCKNNRTILNMGPRIFPGISETPPLVRQRLFTPTEIYYPKAHEKAA